MTTRCKQCGTPSPTLGAERSRCERCAPRTRAGSTNATPADPESSGIIDVRAMLAILEGDGDGDDDASAAKAPVRAQAEARRRIPTPRPSALPLLPSSRPAAASRSRIMSQRTQGRRSLTGVALGLAVALVGLTGYAVAKQPAAAAPSTRVELREVQVPRVEADEGPESTDEAPAEALEAGAPAPTSADADAEPAIEAPAPRKAGRTPRRPTGNTGAKAPSGSDAPTPSAPASKPAAPSGPKADSVDCLLEPKKCAKAPAPVAEPSAPRPAASTLPAKLDASEITAGVHAAKSAAAAKCSGLAKGGETVRLKISIAGASGSVISTKVEEGRAELGACCARELAKATFPKVQKEQTGAVVTVRF